MDDRDHAELLMLYKVTIDDIERAKQWGWKVTYATIAAQGAILGLFSTYKAGTYIVCAKLSLFCWPLSWRSSESNTLDILRQV